jgi:hypothetical protein
LRIWLPGTVGVVSVRQAMQAMGAALPSIALVHLLGGVCMCGIQLRACSSVVVSRGVLGSAVRTFPDRNLVLARCKCQLW